VFKEVAEATRTSWQHGAVFGAAKWPSSIRFENILTALEAWRGQQQTARDLPPTECLVKLEQVMELLIVESKLTI
jgi:hypothetical protein